MWGYGNDKIKRKDGTITMMHYNVEPFKYEGKTIRHIDILGTIGPGCFLGISLYYERNTAKDAGHFKTWREVAQWIRKNKVRRKGPWTHRQTLTF